MGSFPYELGTSQGNTVPFILVFPDPGLVMAGWLVRCIKSMPTPHWDQSKILMSGGSQVFSAGQPGK
jgi:hypothetical protein